MNWILISALLDDVMLDLNEVICHRQILYTDNINWGFGGH